MTKKRASVIVLSMATAVAGLLTSGTASATSDAASARGAANIERVHPIMVADVVVNGAPASQPAAPAVVPVAPVAAPAPAPVVETPAHTSQTTVVEHEQHNYMSTVAVSALMGGLAGALVGGSLYFLEDNQNHGRRIAYWAAGGVLVGAGVGITQIVVQEDRVDRATASRLPTDPAPTLRLALLNRSF
jgi:hypothetical protein